MVSLRAPSREQFAAMALSALAFGTAIGVGLGPGLATQGRAMTGSPILVLPALAAALPQAEPGEPDRGKGHTVARSAAGENRGADPLPFEPEPELPSPIPAPFTQTSTPGPSSGAFYSDDDDGAGRKDRENEDRVAGRPVESEAGTVLAGTVLQVGPETKSYTVADSAAAILTVHAERLPEVGRRIQVPILPRPDGNFDEAGPRRWLGRAGEVRISGTVTFIDPAGRGYAVSNPGSSIAVGLDGPVAETVRLGSRVEISTRFDLPAQPRESKADAASRPDPCAAPPVQSAHQLPQPPVADELPPPVDGEAPTHEDAGDETASEGAPPVLRHLSAEEKSEPTELWNIAARVNADCDGGSRLLISADSAGLLGADLTVHVNERLAGDAPAPGHQLLGLLRHRPDGSLALRSISVTRSSNG